MEVDGHDIHVIEHGEGVPLLIIHGLGSDHRSMTRYLEPVFEKRSGWHRVYVDLPGMGKTLGSPDLASADAIRTLLLGVVGKIAGDDPIAVIGSSFGGYLALGLVEALAARLLGVAALVPVVEPDRDRRILPPMVKVVEDDSVFEGLPPEVLAESRPLIAMETEVVVEGLRDHLLPALAIADEDFVTSLQEHAYALSADALPTDPFDGPALIITGRQDVVVGYEQAWKVQALFPRGTFAVLDGAGHLLSLEQQQLTTALIEEWLDRMEAV